MVGLSESPDVNEVSITFGVLKGDEAPIGISSVSVGIVSLFLLLMIQMTATMMTIVTMAIPAVVPPMMTKMIKKYMK